MVDSKSSVFSFAESRDPASQKFFRSMSCAPMDADCVSLLELDTLTLTVEGSAKEGSSSAMERPGVNAMAARGIQRENMLTNPVVDVE